MERFPASEHLSEEEKAVIKKTLADGPDEIVTHGETMSAGEMEKITHMQKERGIENVGEPIKIKPDLDGKSALFLFDLAGIAYNKATFVKKGSYKPGSINVDTGERPQVSIEADGTIFFDHHGHTRLEKGKETSATSLVYQTLVGYGFLEREPWLDHFVEFITEMDNANYDLPREFFEKEWSGSLYGLYRMLSFDAIVDVFKQGGTVTHPFTKEQIEHEDIKTVDGTTQPIRNLIKKQQHFVEMNIKTIHEAEKQQLSFGIKNFEPTSLKKVVVNLIKPEKNKKGEIIYPNKIPLGFTATRGLGFDSYIIWNPDNGGFFITSVHTLDAVYEKLKQDFPEAKLIRGTMIIQNPTGEKVAGQRFFEDLDLIKK